MGISRGSAKSEGPIRTGKGTMTPAHATAANFSMGSRFEGQQGSNPEELIGAALAGCFSMALSLALEKGGITPKSIESTSDVHLEKQGEGFAITSIDLTSDVSVASGDTARFDAIAEETKKNCPVSKALAGTTIRLTARLRTT